MNAIMKFSQNAEVTITLKEIIEEMKPKSICPCGGVINTIFKIISFISNLSFLNTTTKLYIIIKLRRVAKALR